MQHLLRNQDSTAMSLITVLPCSNSINMCCNIYLRFVFIHFYLILSTVNFQLQRKLVDNMINSCVTVLRGISEYPNLITWPKIYFSLISVLRKRSKGDFKLISACNFTIDRKMEHVIKLEVFLSSVGQNFANMVNARPIDLFNSFLAEYAEIY